MSWKKIACVAAMSALFASPTLAAVPTLSVDLVRNSLTGLAELDASGDWQWVVSVTVDEAGSTASELDGFITDSALVSAIISNSTVFDDDNPSPSALTWVSEVDGILVGGIQTNLPTNELVIAIGGDDVAAGTYELAIVTTVGPSNVNAALTSTVAVSGNIAQDGSNNSVAATLSVTALAGDANLDGSVDGIDFSILSSGFNSPGTWQTGDFNRDGVVDGIDFSILSSAFNSTGPVPALAMAVPEPTSLIILGSLAVAGLTFRSRV